MRKALVASLILGVILLTGWLWIEFRPQETTGVEYTTAPVEFGPAAETVSATGVLHPRQVYPVGSELSGRVVEVCADYLQVVEEGAVLLRLDDRADRSRLEQTEQAVRAARAGVAQAEAARDTARSVYRREHQRPAEVRRDIEVEVAANQLRTAEAAVEVTRVKLAQAEEERRLAALRVDLAVVRAPTLRRPLASPFAPRGIGALDPNPRSDPAKSTFVVLDRRVSLNQMIAPPLSGHLFTLAESLSVLHAETLVAEGDIGKVKPGQAAELTVFGAESGVCPGRVIEIRPLPVSEQGAVFFKAIVEVANHSEDGPDSWALRPGQTATVDIVCRRHERAWRVPNAALNFQLEEGQQTPAARARLADWRPPRDQKHWRPVWVLGQDNRPWPAFVRTGGKDEHGQSGIRDASFTEVLEWDPELSPSPERGNPSTYPRVIIGAPPARQGLLDRPNLRI